MKRALPSVLVGWFLSYARRLKHPQLFKWMCALFLVDLLIPDLVPFVDEILLGLGTLFLAAWKKRGTDTGGEITENESRNEKVVSGTAEKMTDRQEASARRSNHGKH
ncbi:hypothetical protein PVT68_17525 [Microbulbifer bruguierae]|uniref:DUF1232 domain-containing protein n=1 Tax=Microbulbifer bruguierae TaxID=3029061 RepID=A0ABY8NDN2_9GAMM|nr:DUF6116 family protein [Microbulbifer bruguierae]WGL16549.1 hypothetical protein PVT68_17525 [Microbulbifer bruguierae]